MEKLRVSTHGSKEGRHVSARSMSATARVSGSDESAGKCSQLVLAPVADQELVLEHLPQAAQVAAHGRLGHAQPVARLGDVACVQQGVQRQQQVQVVAAQLRDAATPGRHDQPVRARWRLATLEHWFSANVR